jgi:DNA polymerase (family 10)
MEIITLGPTKFMGIVKLNKKESKWRHLDIRLVNDEVLPFAWFYYTGGKIFNKLIREKLKQKGYKLNEWGLYKNNKKVIHIKTPCNFKCIENIEKKIFSIAGLQYKTLQERY